jgi:hypothetical protein
VINEKIKPTPVSHERKEERAENGKRERRIKRESCGFKIDVPKRFFEKLRVVRDDPASARYESTTNEILTVDPKVHPKPIN